ncbi:MAG TPA: D-alanine--D-alanine ligase [Alphaproteobacteria bacterium]|nr:D-alanine--D-alanine ligase [Alphaproteobacteria bacterium]
MKNKKIAIVYGGPSSEAEVSKRTSFAVFNALKGLGYQVEEIEFSRDIPFQLRQKNIDIVYNAMHGRYGEDGSLQGVLEVLDISYTHSGVLASAVAMNKVLTKELVQRHGVNLASGRIYTREDLLPENIQLPVVVKPVSQGSSVGVVILKTRDDFKNLQLTDQNEFLVEEYIEGRELSVAVLDNEGLGVIEIRPKTGVYDYESKYTKGASEYICPAPVPEKIYNIAIDYAVTAHTMLGCKGVTRSDIIYSEKREKLYFLEINTHPGMTESSLVPKIAAYRGIDFKELVEKILFTANVGV